MATKNILHIIKNLILEEENKKKECPEILKLITSLSHKNRNNVNL